MDNVITSAALRKIFITISVSIFSVIQSFGQVSFGLKAGLNISHTDNFGRVENKARLGPNGGLLVEIGIGKKFTVQPELLYSIKGNKFPPTTFSGGGTLSLNYISIPLLGGFRANDRFTILLGPEFNFLSSANSRFDGRDHDVAENFEKFDMAVDLGLAYKIKYGLGIEIRYSYGFIGLTDVLLTDPLGNEIGIGKAGNNSVFQLGVFYKFSGK